MELDQKGQEKKKHGNQQLSLGIYDVILEKSITAHWHKEIEIILVTSGTFQLQVNTQVFSCKAGDIIFINPEELHYFKEDNESSATWKTLVFDVAQLHAMLLDKATVYFVKPVMNGDNKITTVISRQDKGYHRIADLCNHIVTVYEEKYYGFELEIKALMFSLFGVLYRYEYVNEQANNITSLQQVEKIKDVIEYIAHHYTEEITVTDLAALCHYNTEYFMRFFKKHTGTTCGQFIKAYRLEEAAYRLRTTTDPITQVALDVGFINISYFIRSFKEHYHVTPKAFRTK